MIVFHGDRLHAGALNLSPDAAWLRHGVGVFETLLARDGAICHLQRHLERARASLAALSLPAPPPGLADAMRAVIAANGLDAGLARVTLDLGFEQADAPPVPLITARRYAPPPLDGVRLAVEPRRLVSSLCTHKTSSYLHFFLARRRAQAAGAFDAVLLGGDDEVLEASTGALLFSDGEALCAPAATSRLPSIAEAVIAAAEPISARPLALADLDGVRHVFLVNSLVGALPVESIADRRFAPHPARAAALRALVWATA